LGWFGNRHNLVAFIVKFKFVQGKWVFIFCFVDGLFDNLRFDHFLATLGTQEFFVIFTTEFFKFFIAFTVQNMLGMTCKLDNFISSNKLHDAKWACLVKTDSQFVQNSVLE